ncbi:substrate-binding domain-containing protein, partial [Staphylococcus aureus]
RMVDAFILLYSKENDPIKQMLIDESMPFIVIGKPTSDIDHQFTHIDNDNILASENLTRHVIEQGVDELIFITEKGNFEVSKDRIQGFETVASQFNLDYQIIETSNEREVILNYMQNLHTRLKDPNIKQAIISLDAMLHLAILSVLYELNIEIPKDVMTATFNDSYLTEIASPPQTCIDIKPRMLGQQAGSAILNILKNKAQDVIELVIIDTELKIRKSTQR